MTRSEKNGKCYDVKFVMLQLHQLLGTPVVETDDGHRMDISLTPVGSGGVTRRQISRGARTSSEITCEPRPVDLSGILWSVSNVTTQLALAALTIQYQ